MKQVTDIPAHGEPNNEATPLNRQDIPNVDGKTSNPRRSMRTTGNSPRTIPGQKIVSFSLYSRRQNFSFQVYTES